MPRVVVIGGCGIVGSVAVRTLASFDDFDEIIIADINEEGARERAAEIGADTCSALVVDAGVPDSIKNAVEGADVVLNCCGPFYKYGPIVLKAVIEAGIDYVDVCDDFDATKKLLQMNVIAEEAGVTALTGMGSSPGVANLLAKFCADHMLDEVDSIDILHAHGGEPNEGPAVVAHRIHSMLADIPMYLDGRFTTVRYFEESGHALEEDVDFHCVGTYRCYPYPHPETITLPNYIDCQRVTNLGCVIPTEYYDLIRGIVKLGVVEEEPINVRGQEVVPRDFTIAYIISRRDEILEEVGFGTQRGCLKITMKGTAEGKPHQFDFSLASEGQSMGEGTGIPAAIGALLMQRGKVSGRGVLPPEACINPLEFLGLMQEYLKLDDVTGEGSPLIIESIDHEGNTKRIDL
ncbi:saccharopine dehydrogenase [Candidatus Thorarchaeota archaeon]|nr:MAG: saccharopine dehydrogenase [Candidatus Thorarchaeota archaeon]